MIEQELPLGEAEGDMQAALRQHFVYVGGTLISKKAVKGESWDRGHNNHGYVYILWQGKNKSRARLTWIFHNGDIPDGVEVDHINGIRTDDRIENLRLVTKCENNARRLSPEGVDADRFNGMRRLENGHYEVAMRMPGAGRDGHGNRQVQKTFADFREAMEGHEQMIDERGYGLTMQEALEREERVQRDKEEKVRRRTPKRNSRNKSALSDNADGEGPGQAEEQLDLFK